MQPSRPHAMPNVIRKWIVVDQEGILQIRDPELRAGSIADVIVILEDLRGTPRPLTSLIGAAKGLFDSPEEVDEFLLGERRSWDA